jgi:pSer/pThr/pTyr-binding forkhead associated (FHA) protein
MPGPPTEAMADPLPPETDHDGLTVAGDAWQPPPAEPPGIPGQPPAPDVTVPVARLQISNGDEVDVDRAIVIGRAPEARRFNDTEQPRLVTVPSPHLEISSTHIEVRPGVGADHGSAVVTDLGSTNGTVLVQPGLGPEDLAPGVAVQLIPGAIIDLGDGVTIKVTSP